MLLFVYESRPELLQGIEPAEGESSKRSLKAVVAILAVVVLVVGGGLSLLASSNPDGLEWALFGNAEEGYAENMGLDEEAYGVESAAADTHGRRDPGQDRLPAGLRLLGQRHARGHHGLGHRRLRDGRGRGDPRVPRRRFLPEKENSLSPWLIKS